MGASQAGITFDHSEALIIDEQRFSEREQQLLDGMDAEQRLD